MAFALLGGCSDRKSFQGTWEGKRSLHAVPGADPSIVGTLAKVKLTIHPNDRFLLIDGGLPKEGEIQYGGDGPILVVDTYVGQPVPPHKREKLKIRSEERELKLTLPDGDLNLKPLPASDRNGT
ncbi:hypothetical protein BH11ARM2_BH11ARM2_11560 [soil metagenome]